MVCFSAVLYAPGYVVAQATDLFHFRRRSFADRSLWSIACSFCVSPIAAHLLGRVAGLAGVVCLFLLAAAATALLLARSTFQDWTVRQRRIAGLLALGWTLATLLLLTDLQVGHRLYYSVVLADQSYRVAFTDAVARTGIPPANPLYFAGHTAPMRYFYFWYVLCAAVMKMAHVSARQAFTASTVWAGFGLLVTTQLFTRHFFRWPRRTRWLALVLLAVNGADLLPALGQAVLQPTLNGNTEWWSVDPIFAWPDSLLWVPHHVASVLCCLLGFLLLWQLAQPPEAAPAERGDDPATASRAPRDDGAFSARAGEAERVPVLDRSPASSPPAEGGKALAAPVVLAAAAFASAFGLSVYVTAGFALLMAAWLLRIWLIGHARRGLLTRNLVLAGALALLLSGPFLHELVSGAAPTVPGSPAQPAAHLFTLSVRQMIDSGLLIDLPLFASVHRTHPMLLDQALRLVLLVPGLAMELGVYGAVLVLLFLGRKKANADPHGAHATALFLALTGLGMTLFLSSAVITNNDFGYRAVMLPQFMLLLLTAELLGAWWFGAPAAPVAPTPAKLLLVRALFILGVAGTVWWAVLLRLWLPLEAAHPRTGYARSPEEAFQFREAFQSFDRIAPKAAVVAFRPIDPTLDRQGAVMVPNEYYQRLLVMDTGRQFLNAEGKCATHFGGDPAPCSAIQSATARLYATPGVPAIEARQFCRRFGVDYLLLSPWDRLWGTRSGWPGELPAVVQQPRLTILHCR